VHDNLTPVHETGTAEQRDAADLLARYRDRFVFPEPDLVYLDGNSLGRLPQTTVTRAGDVVTRGWGERLIRSWNEDWWEAPLRIGDALAPLIGAGPGEVAIADSTSVNLFKLAVAALRARPGRRRIVTDDLNFPSDLYILSGAADLTDDGRHVEVTASGDGVHGPADTIVHGLDNDVALVTLSLVTFKSGYLYDLEAITRATHDVGALVLWDLSHAAGAVPIDLGGAGADLAVGCTYKYLNGGPGAPAFLYVRRDLQDRLDNPITGWWGHTRPFDFSLGYAATGGIRRFLTGTPPIVSTLLIEPGVAMIADAGIRAIRAKSEAQTAYLIERWERDLSPLGFSLNTPRTAARRGAHVSLGHPEGLGIDLALINDYAVLPDFRPPDHLRFGLAPLTTRYVDIDTAVDALIDIVATGRHRDYQDTRPAVT
jgi:kynureninase